MKTIHKINTSLAALIASSMLSGALYASTAANTVITNTVSVNFDDTAGNAQSAVTSSVSLTVNLLPSAPIVSSPANIDPTTENSVNSLVYTITGTANGEDTYNFSAAHSNSNMLADATSNTPSITLGGTTLAANAEDGDTSITVPYDAVANASVNGIAENDTIIIGLNSYVVGAIDESVVTNNTVQIPLTSAIMGGTVSIGEIVGEQGSVTVDVTVDEIDSGASGTHTVSSTATSAADTGVSTTQTTATVITVRKPVLDVEKYVRNVDTGAGGTGTPVTIDGNSFYLGGVSGQPGDEMQYLIVVDNTATGAGVADNIIVSDPIPQFTSLESGSIAIDASGTASTLGAFASLTEAEDGDAAELDPAGNGTVIVYAGSTGNLGDDTLDEGGSMLANETVRIIFSVTID